jgi:hypothetical protein
MEPMFSQFKAVCSCRIHASGIGTNSEVEITDLRYRLWLRKGTHRLTLPAALPDHHPYSSSLSSAGSAIEAS